MNYEGLLEQVMRLGEDRPTRGVLASGVPITTRSLFGTQMRFSLRDSFPLVTTKRVGVKGFVTELLWFLRGDTNTAYLHKYKCSIWDEWADADGKLGPVYGAQWRNWGGVGIDQIAELEHSLVKDPYGRRHILSAWNVADIPDMALPPCHMMCQFYVSVNGTLSCHLYQRSADLFLGVPWNIASYSLLACMFADTLGLKRGDFVHTIGDAHIYSNHFKQVREQLSRTPYPFPQLVLDKQKSVLDYKHEHIRIEGYQHHPHIAGEVAI